MVLDIILLGIVAILVFLGIKRGIAKTLLNLLSIFFAGAVGCFLANIGSKWIYSTFIAPDVSDSVAKSFEQAGNNTTGIIENMPDFTKGLLTFFGITDESLASSVNSGVNTAADAVTGVIENTIANAVISVLNIVLIIVLFLLLLIIFKLISRHLVKIFRVPVLKQINKFLGGALGLCEGLILCYIGIIICSIIVPLNNDFIVSQELISQSVVFKSAYYSDFVQLFSSSAEIGHTVLTDVQNSLIQ